MMFRKVARTALICAKLLNNSLEVLTKIPCTVVYTLAQDDYTSINYLQLKTSLPHILVPEFSKNCPIGI